MGSVGRIPATSRLHPSSAWRHMPLLRYALLIALLSSAPVHAQHGGHGSAPARRVTTPTPPDNTVYPPQRSPGEVALLLAPRWSDGRLVILMAATTHAVELPTLDLHRAMRLIVNGEVVVPVLADTLRGQESRARLVFPLRRKPSHFTLEIRGIPDVDLRTLHWPAQPDSGR